MKKRGQGSNLRRAMIWNTTGNIIYSFCQWLITILVVRLASYEQAGYLSLAMTTSSTYSTIALFRMRDFQVSDVKKEYNSGDYTGSRVVTCQLGMLACLAAAAMAGAGWYQALCIDLFMLVRIAEASHDVLAGVDQMHDRYDFIGISLCLRGGITVIVFSIVITLAGNMAVAILGMAAGNLLVVFLYDVRMTSHLENIKPKFSKKIWKLLATCIPLVLFSFMNTLVNLVPKQDLQDITSTKILGVYSSIASPTLVVQVFASYIFAPILPKISEILAEKKYNEFQSHLHKIYAILAIFIGVIYLIGRIFGRLGLLILYGRDILEYTNWLYPVVLCTALLATVWILSSIVVALRRTIAMVVCMILSMGFLFPMSRYLIKVYGPNGASYVQIFTYLFLSAGLVIIIEDSLHKLKNRQIKND